MIPLFTPLHADEYKTRRNKKAYTKFLLGTGLSAAAIGCFVGGLLLSTRGLVASYSKANYGGALGCLIFGPTLVVLSIPTGEFGFTRLKDGLIGLFTEEEQEEIAKKNKTPINF